MRRQRDWGRRGATAVEYALICALIFIIFSAAMWNLYGEVGNTFNYVASSLPF